MSLMQANRQWASRPEDERYVSLIEMQNHFNEVRSQSREAIKSNRNLDVVGRSDEIGLDVMIDGVPYEPTHWSFEQIATLAHGSASYLRKLPASLTADCLNYGLQFLRENDDVGILTQKNGDSILRAVTGPKYGRVWNAEILHSLVKHFGDGVNGDWRVPGEFGKAVVVDKRNTTLFASDRDMFVFLADEDHRIEVPNRRHGQPGLMARGFFIWNSETALSTVGIASFLFDYVCCNRIVWGAEQFKEVRIRHTMSAPSRFLEQVVPMLEMYANSAPTDVVTTIANAKQKMIGDKLDEFLAKRQFGKKIIQKIKAIHEIEEERPIETLWDTATAITAYARGIEWQNERVDLEAKAGQILQLAANQPLRLTAS